MRHEVEQYLGLLEKRLSTLRLVAAGFMEGREAFTELNLAAIHRHLAQQESFCSEIRFLDDELGAVEKRMASEWNLQPGVKGLEALQGHLEPASAERLRALLMGLTAIQSDVRRLNRVHAELLRRSRRTINVLINVIGNRTGTYQPPATRPAYLAASARPGE